jgi:kynurenine formamidase
VRHARSRRHGLHGNPAHHALLGNEVYIVENLNNLDRLPPFCLFLALPLKIRVVPARP